MVTVNNSRVALASYQCRTCFECSKPTSVQPTPNRPVSSITSELVVKDGEDNEDYTGVQDLYAVGEGQGEAKWDQYPS